MGLWIAKSECNDFRGRGTGRGSKSGPRRGREQLEEGLGLAGNRVDPRLPPVDRVGPDAEPLGQLLLGKPEPLAEGFELGWGHG